MAVVVTTSALSMLEPGAKARSGFSHHLFIQKWMLAMSKKQISIALLIINKSIVIAQG
ncbi:hypothetical protein KKH3_24890 [Pectobacterium actinidiae]|nr:hypothetical protein KKH3_24890 [Pectobacterium actinidiae]